METVRHDKNGHVLGFDRLNIDPMTTRRRVLAELESAGLATVIGAAQVAIKAAVKVTHGPEGATVHYAANHGQLVAAHSKAVTEYGVEYARLTKALAVYFQPRAGETVLPPDELAKLREQFAALGPGQKLTLEGEVV